MLPSSAVAWLEEILRRADGLHQWGGTVRFSPDDFDAMRATLNAATRPPLSVREREVMHAAGQGMTNSEIAAALVIAPDTVRCHLKSIYGKLGLRSRAALIRYVVERERG